MEIMTEVPMTGYVVVFNDEFYNFIDLRRRRVADGQAQSTGRRYRPNQARALPSGPSRHVIGCFEFREKRHLLANVPSFMSGVVACPYDAPPDAALAAVQAHGGPVLVDFDETLYLRNSTEDFIDCVWPGLLGLLLLRMLEVLKPWRLTGGIDTRDSWRACAISTLFPWTHRRWRAKVQFFAERYVNQELRAALKAQAQAPVILTIGFKSIVTPLLAAMGFADVRLIAARMHSFADRRDGKLRMVTRELGAETVSSCLIVTDSVGDLEVLQSCARPLRTVWPGARYRRALCRVYLPGEYISQIKRPGERYIVRGILQEDFAFWLLSSIGLAINPASHLVGVLLLMLSFWAIYERGYVDNDLAASRYEAEPKLSEHFGYAQVATPPVQPWIWALLAGAAGVAVLHPDRMAFVMDSARWIAVLIFTYACFKFYNRLDKGTRVWLYPLLQLARSAAFTVIVPITSAGVAALGAHVLSRWVPYHVYRLTSRHWPVARPELVRAISFVLLALLTVCSFGLSVMLTWSALALLLWNIFRARHDVYAVCTAARRIDL
jgi:phosphoserine phosphatase